MNAKCLFLGATCALILCLNLVTPSTSEAAPIDYTLNFKNVGLDVPVQTRAWLPDTPDRLKGLLLAIPGSGTDTRGMVGNTLWQFRLMQMGFGIVGFRDVAGFPVLTGSSKEETRDNFQFLMDTVANSFSHPEIKNAPVILDGISKGGYNVSFLGPYLSDRTICYIADKGYQPPFVDDLADLQVPGIAIGGAHDEVVPPQVVQFGFAQSRSNGAKLAMLVDWHHGHLATNQITKLAFMDQALRVRYPQNQLPSLTPNTPLPLVDISHLPGAWLGEANQLDDTLTSYVPIDSPVITPEAVYPKDPSLASWLPTEAMAMVYRAHNDNSSAAQSLQIDVTRFFGEVTLAISALNIPATTVRLYHNEDLVGTLDLTNGPVNFTYTPTKNGLHTFIAVADYLDGGVLKQTSNYTATVVGGVVTVPEPHVAALLTGGLAIGCLRRKQYDSSQRAHIGTGHKSRDGEVFVDLFPVQADSTAADFVLQSLRWCRITQ